MFNKSEWKTVKLGDVALEVKMSGRFPFEERYTRLIGLEHIDPGDLHIHRFDEISEETTFTKLFHKGQILFGRRRAYQKKAAVAEFDGVCSGDITVIESNGSIDPLYLPFVIQNDTFFDYAVTQSAGSLSPRVKWADISKFEFSLPPLYQQRRIADLLWSADDVACSYNDALNNALVLKKSIFESYVKSDQKDVNSIVWRSIPSGWSLRKLDEVGDVAYGISEAVSGNTDASIGWPILTGANITLDSSLDLRKLVYIEPPKNERFVLKKGDILFNWRSGSKEHVGKTAIFNLNGNWTHASFILRIRVFDDIVSNNFLNYLIGYMKEKGMFGGATTQQINFKLNASTLRNLDVVIPPHDIQAEIVGRMTEIEDLIFSLQRTKEHMIACRTGLIELR